MQEPSRLALAHSAKPEKGIPVQTYVCHIDGTKSVALVSATDACRFYWKDPTLILRTISLSAEGHDLGKLLEENQDGLYAGNWGKLKYKHADAGFRCLYDVNPVSAVLVAAHHRGLFDFKEEYRRKKEMFREAEVMPISDKYAYELCEKHFKATGRRIPVLKDDDVPTWAKTITPFEWRFMLSCLVEGDHQDTANHYNSGDTPPAELRAVERLAALDAYVAGLAKCDLRSEIRSMLYRDCRTLPVVGSYFYCPGAVGTGKTFANMVKALRIAIEKGLRRIFVILPMTSLIDQTVKRLREALCLPGENPENVVAAHHHKVEFKSMNGRHLSTTWKCPIIVTTSVQFFETLAGCKTSALRKLHALPGSVVVIDESDVALPPKLWRMALKWIKELGDHWSCNFIFSSGTLTKVWEIKEFLPEARMDFRSVCSPETEKLMLSQEKQRVTYKPIRKRVTLEECCDLCHSLPMPCLVSMGTIDSAAALARRISEKYGRDMVEHLSSAILPKDRNETFKRIFERLKRGDKFILVGTTVVTTGQDMSFVNGMIERMTFALLLQGAGRVNRECERTTEESVIYDFEIIEDEKTFFKKNREFEYSSIVAGEMFKKYGYDDINGTQSTEALKKELEKKGIREDWIRKLDQFEEGKMFRTVSGLEGGEHKFKVIEDKTVLVVMSNEIRDKLEKEERVTPEDLHKNSVSMSRARVKELGLLAVKGHDEDDDDETLYAWDLPYDSFLGYMKGVFQRLENNYDIV